MYDGSVNIDTKLSTAGFNKGTKSIASSLSGVLRAIKGVGAALGLAFSGAAIFGFIKNAIQSFDLMSSSIGGSVKSLSESVTAMKGAFTNLIISALAPLVPYVIAAVNWFTSLFNTLTQVIRALFGVRSAMAGVASSTADAGKEAKKALGPLAAFDQINVLPGKNDAGSGDTTGAPSLPVVPPISTELLDKVLEFKEKFIDFFKPLTDSLDRLKVALEPLSKTLWAGLQWAWDHILVPLGEWTITDLAPAFLDMLAGASTALNEALIALQPVWQEFYDQFLQPLAEWVGGKIVEFLDWFTERLYDLADWIKENPENFNIIIGLIAALAASLWLANAAMAIGAAATSLYTLVMSGFITTMLAAAIPFLTLAALIFAVIVLVALLVANWDTLKTTISQLMFIFGWWISTYIVEPLKSGFGSALDWIEDKFTKIFEGIKSFVKSTINSIIDFVNGMLSGITDGINGLVGGFNIVGSIIPGFVPVSEITAPQIPRLANGAVIPPNAEFAAILGDQKSGKNIESPVSLMQQTFEESLAKALANQNIHISFDGDLGALVRELKPYIDRNNRNIGSSLISSGAI